MTFKPEQISVVVPIYNSSKYIIQTLDSIKSALDDHVYEIILVDDCSDDLLEIKKILFDNYPNAKVIEKRKKSNAADSRNIGFLASKYEKVFFLDSDDHFTREYIFNRLNIMNSNDYGVFFGGYITLDKNGKKISYVKKYDNGNMRDYLFLSNGDFRTSTVSINKIFHKGTLFDSQMKKHQDWGLGIRCYDANEKIFYDETSNVVINIGRNDQMSATMNTEASKYFIATYILEKKYIIKFVELHIVRAIQNKDFAALTFYFWLLRDTKLYGKKKMIFALLRLGSIKGIIDISSPILSGIRYMKNLFR